MNKTQRHRRWSELKWVHRMKEFRMRIWKGLLFVVFYCRETERMNNGHESAALNHSSRRQCNHTHTLCICKKERKYIHWQNQCRVIVLEGMIKRWHDYGVEWSAAAPAHRESSLNEGRIGVEEGCSNDDNIGNGLVISRRRQVRRGVNIISVGL